MQRELNGLVLRSVKYGDTSLILDIYTAELGLETFIVGGARKQKSKMPASIFQLMHWVNFISYYSDNKPMHRIKEARVLEPYQQLPFDLQRRSIGLFMLEVVQKTSQVKEANPALFQMLQMVYRNLDSDDDYLNIHLSFLIEYATYLGIGMQQNYSEEEIYFDKHSGIFREIASVYTMNKEDSYALYQLMRSSATKVVMTNKQRKMLIDELLQFYKIHIDQFKEPKCLEILKLVLH